MSRSKLTGNRLMAHNSNSQQGFRTPECLPHTSSTERWTDSRKREENYPWAGEHPFSASTKGCEMKECMKSSRVGYANSDSTRLRWPISRRVRWVPQAPSLNRKHLMPDSTGAIKRGLLQDFLQSQTNKQTNTVCSEKPAERSKQIVPDLHLQSLRFSPI